MSFYIFTIVYYKSLDAVCQLGLISFCVFSIFLSKDEFYKQLQAIRQPWHIPSDTDSDILEPPEQDKSAYNTHFPLLDSFLSIN